MPTDGGVLQAHPVLAYAATAVPATMDGGGVLYDTQGSARDRSADGAVARRSPHRGGRRSSRRTRRSNGCAAATSAGRCCVSSSRCSRRRRAGAGSGVGFLGAVRSVRAARRAAPVPARIVSGATREPRPAGRASRARGSATPTPSKRRRITAGQRTAGPRFANRDHDHQSVGARRAQRRRDW